MFTLNSTTKQLNIDKPLVMGVLNCTDDSFYEGSRSLDVAKLEQRIERMIAEGADIIDVGGQSTRPGAVQIDTEEEIQRIRGALSYLKATHPNQWISIDTTSAKVAQFAVAHGADMINDISAGNMDENMISTVSALHVPYVCMHMQGTPKNMQIAPQYDNVTHDVISFFTGKLTQLTNAGIKQVVIDPGFGFGKTIDHNFQLMNELESFHQFNLPLLVGISRKSMIYKVLGCSPEDALNGTTVLNTIALQNGAHILRVHDVKEAKEAIILLNRLIKQ